MTSTDNVLVSDGEKVSLLDGELFGVSLQDFLHEFDHMFVAEEFKCLRKDEEFNGLR